jgi:hypothetical protein
LIPNSVQVHHFANLIPGDSEEVVLENRMLGTEMKRLLKIQLQITRWFQSDNLAWDRIFLGRQKNSNLIATDRNILLKNGSLPVLHHHFHSTFDDEENRGDLLIPPYRLLAGSD